MKRIIILTILAAIGLYGGAAAQGTGLLASAASNGNQNMVRYDATTGDYIFALPHFGGIVHFMKTDMTTYTEVKVIIPVTVTDFEIIDRFVFFCGEYYPSGGGVIGWFNIDTLFTTGIGVHAKIIPPSDGVLSLNNIEVYEESGKYYLAGYGRDSNLDYIAFEAYGNPYTSLQFRTLLMEYDGENPQLTDMVVTDNYVVYLRNEIPHACSAGGTLGVTLIPFHKYMLFTPPYDSAYFFQTSPYSTFANYIYPEAYEPLNDIHSRIVKLKGDLVTVCAHRRNVNFLDCLQTISVPWPDQLPCACANNIEDMNTYLTLRSYDLTPLTASGPIVMTAANAAFLSNGGATSISGFCYDSTSNHYIVLHRHKSATGVTESAVTTCHPTTSASSEYQTVYDTYNTWMPCSLCLGKNSDYLVGGFMNNSSASPLIFWYNNIFTGPTNCSRVVSNNLSSLPLVPHKSMYNLHEPTAWMTLMFQEYKCITTKSDCPKLCD